MRDFLTKMCLQLLPQVYFSFCWLKSMYNAGIVPTKMIMLIEEKWNIRIVALVECDFWYHTGHYLHAGATRNLHKTCVCSMYTESPRLLIITRLW